MNFLKIQTPLHKGVIICNTGSRSPVSEREDNLKGDTPNPIDLPKGCRFSSRCPYKMDICTIEEPELIDDSNEHYVSCHLKLSK